MPATDAINQVDGSHVLFEEHLKELEDFGLSNRKKNIKLLLKTNGDFATVKNFLLAKQNMKSAVKNCKKMEKKSKHDLKIMKKKQKKYQNRSECRGGRRYGRDRDCREGRDGRENRRHSDHWASPSPSAVVVGQDVFQYDASTAAATATPMGAKEVAKDFAEDSQSASFPKDTVKLFLDGNNMMFVLEPLRSLTLNHKRLAAEAAIASVATRFAEVMKLKECVLVFDDTKKVFNDTSKNFSVICARPSFPTSDDLMVDLVEKARNSGDVSLDLSKWLFVTSDRELRARLTQLGASVMSPKEWFFWAASSCGGSSTSLINNSNNNGAVAGGRKGHLDAWMRAWIDEMNLHVQTKNMNIEN